MASYTMEKKAIIYSTLLSNRLSPKTSATWHKKLTHWKRLWCWERLKAGGEESNGGWDGWMASPTQWTWVWALSRRWWRTGKPRMLQSVGSQRVGQDWVTEQQQQCQVLIFSDLATSLRDSQMSGQSSEMTVGIGGGSVWLQFWGAFYCIMCHQLSPLPSGWTVFSSLAVLGLCCGTRASLVMRLEVHRFSCPVACGVLAPRPGMTPASPAFEGGFLTTVSPGKSLFVWI